MAADVGPVDVERFVEQARQYMLTPDLAVQIFNNSPDAIIVVGSHGLIKLVNPKAELLFRYHRSEMIGQPVEMLIPDDLRAKHAQHRSTYAEYPRHRPMGAGSELAAKRKDDTTFMVEITLAPVQTTDGMITIAYIRHVQPQSSG